MRVKPGNRGTRFQKIHSLKCYQEVYSRACAGWPMTELARFIQEERKEYTDVKRPQLEFSLREWRKTIPAADLVAKRFPEVFEDAKESIENGLDELQELEELYRVQMHRINIDFRTEGKIGKLMPSMTSEIREARQLLETIGQLKMELGIHQRAATKHEVTVDGQVDARIVEDTTEYGAAVQKVMDNAESRRRVQGLVDRFVKMSDKGLAALPPRAAPADDIEETEDDSE